MADGFQDRMRRGGTGTKSRSKAYADPVGVPGEDSDGIERNQRLSADEKKMINRWCREINVQLQAGGHIGEQLDPKNQYVQYTMMRAANAGKDVNLDEDDVLEVIARAARDWRELGGPVFPEARDNPAHPMHTAYMVFSLSMVANKLLAFAVETGVLPVDELQRRRELGEVTAYHRLRSRQLGTLMKLRSSLPSTDNEIQIAIYAEHVEQATRDHARLCNRRYTPGEAYDAARAIVKGIRDADCKPRFGLGKAPAKARWSRFLDELRRAASTQGVDWYSETFQSHLDALHQAWVKWNPNEQEDLPDDDSEEGRLRRFLRGPGALYLRNAQHLNRWIDNGKFKGGPLHNQDVPAWVYDMMGDPLEPVASAPEAAGTEAHWQRVMAERRASYDGLSISDETAALFDDED